jgi:uncharacterized protein YyaL (SSP411 family)
MRYYSDSKNNIALDMVVKTLTEMRKGGVYDHIGFGFHRYSTDSRWFLPHFEKMLYDQAMLLIAYSEAYQITGNSLFKKTASEIIEYVVRDMTSKEGGFYSAEDADSEGEEGKFYVWTKDEVLEILEEDEGRFISEIFNLEENGNYFEETSRKRTGTNILFLENDIEDLLTEYNISEKEFNEKLEAIRNILFNERTKRTHPYKDDKILTDWNGLMIAALAIAARVFEQSSFLKLSENCAEFITQRLFNEEGELLHRFREGEASIKGMLDDYSFLIWGLLEIYETNFNIKFLQKALELTDYVIRNFWDKKNNSGFFFTSEKELNLISRKKEFYDGAIPSGNSVMYINLLKINKITSNPIYMKYSERLALAFKAFIDKSEAGFSMFLNGIQFMFGNSYEIIIVGEKNSDGTKKFTDAINKNFFPHKVVIMLNNKNREELIKVAPFLETFNIDENKTWVYVCKSYACDIPVNTIEGLNDLLQN